jgi:hypothetical protein
MTAKIYNITIEQGATFRLNLVWRNPDLTPKDLTGYTARMQVRRRHSDPDILLEFTTENGAIILGGAAGTISIVGLATLTDDVSVKQGVYDLELVNGTDVDRIVEGSVEITPEVTR